LIDEVLALEALLADEWKEAHGNLELELGVVTITASATMKGYSSGQHGEELGTATYKDSRQSTDMGIDNLRKPLIMLHLSGWYKGTGKSRRFNSFAFCRSSEIRNPEHQVAPENLEPLQ
jgi:hypothetical protein